MPKLILLDAVGTIFGIKNNVGFAYAEIAQKYGVNGDADILNTAFYDSFKSAPPLAFSPQENPSILQQLEYDWWQNIAYETFEQVNLISEFNNFEEFFKELYDYFSTAEPWFIYDDVIPALNYWRDNNIDLGIVSNFDSRIYQVLDNLQLSQYFSTVTISSQTGVAKPEAQIFLTALKQNNCSPDEVWYIGDSAKEDYWGARNVGIKSFWLKRH
ncbi:MAG: HAD-IA family hydrolase [Cyanobacterium sp. T60_A2020_053]|nr:HAD-IA family hydrolase [Cyanobacterium sp. T60_A2020_053]